MKLFLVRHGRTEFNLQHRFQGGKVDSPLLMEGVKKAENVGSYLSTTKFSKVYSSPQTRAFRTAELIVVKNQFKTPINVIEDLREFEFGTWDGKPEVEVKENSQYKNLIEHPDKYQPSLAGNGETYEQFLDRSTTALQSIILKNSIDNHNNILIVTHGNFISMTVKWLLGVPLSQIRNNECRTSDGQVLKTKSHGIVDNDSLTTLKVNGENSFKLVTWNKTVND